MAEVEAWIAHEYKERIEEGMTPELEAKAREWLKAQWGDSWESISSGVREQTLEELVKFAAAFAASQLSAERAWWIERIEQEQQRWLEEYTWDRSTSNGGAWAALDDLLTSVRERGGK